MPTYHQRAGKGCQLAVAKQFASCITQYILGVCFAVTIEMIKNAVKLVHWQLWLDAEFQSGLAEGIRL